jgi:hypothetical protein
VLSELQREWREQVLQRLNNLADGQERINQKISAFENTFARESRLEKIVAEQNIQNAILSNRITKLENVYMKAIGASIVIQVIVASIITLLAKL